MDVGIKQESQRFCRLRLRRKALNLEKISLMISQDTTQLLGQVTCLEKNINKYISEKNINK